MPSKYNWRKLESKWQKKWAALHLHETDPKPAGKKFFVTAAYPYPNSPQHIGHGRTYTIADVDARFHRMKGYNTLFPMGFHYTGAPLFAMAKRLSQNDPEIIKTFTNVYKIPHNELDSLKHPLAMAEYFRDNIKTGMIEMGFSIDWRREFTTIDPLYTRFIEWHFHWLIEHQLITRGTHPVAWCPNDKNPVGTVDTQGDIEPQIGEQYLIKFEGDGVLYPTATLRPETVFGVTNLWVNRNSAYVQARVDDENWIVSKETVEKLLHQNHKVDVEKEFLGKDLVGRRVLNSITGSTIPIFPAGFVEPDDGTGVVMSVPAHAPYDYQALIDLKADKQIDQDLLRNVQPIPIIQLEGFSEYPAKDLVEKFGVREQNDSRLEDATKELYSREFRDGRMRDNAAPYSGMPVNEARDAVVKQFVAANKVVVLYELTNGPIFCRCGAKCLVHIVENQWFINYGDLEWKKLAHQCLDKMEILPVERRPEFEYALDWLKERACARKVGLGTRLPWDKNWVIEALSDSVIYMAYYILAKHISKEWTTFAKFKKDTEKLPDAFFNHIFLGEGSPEKLASATGIPRRVLKAIREEFTYFYPVDMRHSAKDLVTNHLSFYIFHHAALFPQEFWPKGIVPNGFVLMDKTKMSKSLENIIPLRLGISEYGADPLRIALLATAELNQDTDFSDTLAASVQERLVNIISKSRKIGAARIPGKRSKPCQLDKWMLSRLNKTVNLVTNAMERLRLREAINLVLYQLDNDVSWYQRRLGPVKSKGNERAQVLKRLFEIRARLLSPIAPHVAEELWANIGGKGLASTANWPKVDPSMINNEAELTESIVTNMLEDTLEILKATGITPKRIVYYSAAPWKWEVYLKALETASDEKAERGGFIRAVMADNEMRKIGKPAADYANTSMRQASQMNDSMRRSRLEAKLVNERSILQDAAEFYKREFKSEVRVFEEGDVRAYDPQGKAKFAEPYRPAIYVE